MATPSLFSASAAVIINKRLVSQRGGIIPSVSQSEDSLRFKLFINSNSSSVRYGLTLQISAHRDMSKEHNIDQIPEHQAYVYFPTSSLFQYNCITLRKDGSNNKGFSEKQLSDMDKTVRTFWVKIDAEFDEMKHLMFTCTGASVDTSIIPKLRSRQLESDLTRIFGTVKTANEIEEACLEIDCLLPTMDGATEKAVWTMHNAAHEDLKACEAKSHKAEKKQSTHSSIPKTVRQTPLERWYDRAMLSEGKSVKGNTTTPKRSIIPAIIDGKFVSNDWITFSLQEKRLSDANAKDCTPNKTASQKYLHPHSFHNESPKNVTGLSGVKCELCKKEDHYMERCEMFRELL